MGDSTSVFHVVCRDCRTEAVEPTERAAEAAARRHRSAANHCIVFNCFEADPSTQRAND